MPDDEIGIAGDEVQLVVHERTRGNCAIKIVRRRNGVGETVRQLSAPDLTNAELPLLS